MKTYNYKKLSAAQYEKLYARPFIDLEAALKEVKPMLEDIKKNGLKAVLKYSKALDGFNGKHMLVQPEEYEQAERDLNPEAKKALNTAFNNIAAFHRKQKPAGYEIETMPGVKCSREYRAIENVGLYVPGGSAVLPSTMLMLGIPAKLAGCKRIVACSPTKYGRINNALLYAAKLTGVTEFYKIGGAQAIGLMAYGAGSIMKVSKIFGPGNHYVTAAKMLVSTDMKGCPIDMPAGPSEVLIIADGKANPAFIAADLLSQAEHGKDSQTVLISTSERIVKETLEQIKEQVKLLPRKKMAAEAIKTSFALLVDTIDEAIEVSNDYAPEHLILHVNQADKYKSMISNAGSVFLGGYSPESVGDYASGTNHALPTYGYAKSAGGVTVESFMKPISFQSLTKEGLEIIGPTVETIAETEGLAAHRNSVTIRLRGNKK